MTDIKSMNESELRKIVSDQSDAILRLIHHLVEKDNVISDLKEKLEAQETISEIQKMALDDKKNKGWIYYGVCTAPAANKRYLVKLANDWVCCATYYLDHQQNGNCQWKWKGDNDQEIISVKYWKGLEE